VIGESGRRSLRKRDYLPVFLHDARHVVLDGFFANTELLCDHPVAQTGGHFAQYLALAETQSAVSYRSILVLTLRSENGLA
jgi:hypothetical protein